MMIINMVVRLHEHHYYTAIEHRERTLRETLRETRRVIITKAMEFHFRILSSTQCILISSAPPPMVDRALYYFPIRLSSLFADLPSVKGRVLCMPFQVYVYPHTYVCTYGTYRQIFV